MTKLYREQDAQPQLLDTKTVAILGYGSQGKAHALNLRDSGIKVQLGLREGGKTWQQATTDGFTPKSFAEATRDADFIMMLMPDMAQPQVFTDHVEANMKPGATLMFAHGFNIHYKQIKPNSEHDIIMVAPKSPGHLVREEFERGAGVPCLIAVAQDASGNAKQTALAYAHAIGGTRAGVLETTFDEETETDLFGEQAVLCGGAVELIKTGWETLTEAGYQPELAYFECLHELKLIVDLFYHGGIQRMQHFVSDTANYGAVTRGPRIINQQTKDEMKRILTEIQDGKFAKEWIDEHQQGSKNFHQMLEKNDSHAIETTGAEMRSHMKWLHAGA